MLYHSTLHVHTTKRESTPLKLLTSKSIVFFSMYAILGSILLTAAIVYGSRSRSTTSPLPPGPRGLPWIGNAFQMPRRKQWMHFNHWALVYGNIYHLRVFSAHYIVLNTAKAASDLLDKRSAIYSDRPTFVMGGELVGRDVSVVFSHYGERLRTYRRLLHAYLNPNSSQMYLDIQIHAVDQFVQGILEHPGETIPRIRAMTGAIVLRIAYGYIVKDGKDYYVDLAEELAKMTGEAIQPGRWLVDSFPILRHVPSWFPGAGFKRWAAEKRKRSDEILFSPLKLVHEQMTNGTALPSFTADLLKSTSLLGPDAHHIIACAASSFYAAGTDTTASTLETFFLMMMLHPDVQRKAQEEIDTVLDNGRLPDPKDRSSLPYIECIIKEVYRIHPAAPMILHSVMKDDDYAGYHIPAGCNMLINLWSICHNESTYPDPDRFWPERFMPDSSNEVPPDPRQFVFGYGRRSCPGKYFGDTTVFLCIARTLATVNITPDPSSMQQRDISQIQFTSAPVSHPKRFQCKIMRRSEVL
ncbi:cytochrome P450 [Mycena capillaripes]|nr:cytochrome P450 [Mycena capillaripes]